ncbi:hypothetical protein pb186bvf_021119 [Paramecium bursaria]
MRSIILCCLILISKQELPLLFESFVGASVSSLTNDEVNILLEKINQIRDEILNMVLDQVDQQNFDATDIIYRDEYVEVKAIKATSYYFQQLQYNLPQAINEMNKSLQTYQQNDTIYRIVVQNYKQNIFKIFLNYPEPSSEYPVYITDIIDYNQTLDTPLQYIFQTNYTFEEGDPDSSSNTQLVQAFLDQYRNLSCVTGNQTLWDKSCNQQFIIKPSGQLLIECNCYNLSTLITIVNMSNIQFAEIQQNPKIQYLDIVNTPIMVMTCGSGALWMLFIAIGYLLDFKHRDKVHSIPRLATRKQSMTVQKIPSGPETPQNGKLNEVLDMKSMRSMRSNQQSIRITDPKTQRQFKQSIFKPDNNKENHQNQQSNEFDTSNLQFADSSKKIFTQQKEDQKLSDEVKEDAQENTEDIKKEEKKEEPAIIIIDKNPLPPFQFAQFKQILFHLHELFSIFARYKKKLSRIIRFITNFIKMILTLAASGYLASFLPLYLNVIVMIPAVLGINGLEKISQFLLKQSKMVLQAFGVIILIIMVLFAIYLFINNYTDLTQQYHDICAESIFMEIIIIFIKIKLQPWLRRNNQQTSPLYQPLYGIFWDKKVQRLIRLYYIKDASQPTPESPDQKMQQQ